jgi:uncharacterized 2Fe-2S/4Fe-4S cluster protein (DUF4445 family)
MSTDPLVIFTPSGKRGRFPVGTPVLTAARQLGVDLDSVCGGRGICSKCQVSPSYGDFPKHGVTVAADALSEWNAVEERYDRVRGLAEGRRLGCQATVQGDIVIDVPPESQVHRQVVRKAASARPITMDPATRVVLVEVAEPDMHEPSGDLERLKAALAEQWEITGVTAPLPSCSACNPRCARATGRSASRCTARQFRQHEILGVWPGLHEGGLYGLAIDLGSTTIAAHLCDLGRSRAGLRGRDEPADPLRRGPDEPGELRHDEPRRRQGNDRGRARGHRRPRQGAGGGGRDRPRPRLRTGHRLQPGDAPPPAGHRPGGTGPGALRARHRRQHHHRRA